MSQIFSTSMWLTSFARFCLWIGAWLTVVHQVDSHPCPCDHKPKDEQPYWMKTACPAGSFGNDMTPFELMTAIDSMISDGSLNFEVKRIKHVYQSFEDQKKDLALDLSSHLRAKRLATPPKQLTEETHFLQHYAELLQYHAFLNELMTERKSYSRILRTHFQGSSSALRILLCYLETFAKTTSGLSLERQDFSMPTEWRCLNLHSCEAHEAVWAESLNSVLEDMRKHAKIILKKNMPR